MKLTQAVSSLLFSGCSSILLSASTVDANSLIYANTRICSRHFVGQCLSLASDSAEGFVTLDTRNRLRFEVEEVEGINMNVNRIFTFAEDESTRESVKSCLVSKEMPESGATGLVLAPCDTSDRELVLALSAPLATPKLPSHLSADEFTLRELTYMEREVANAGSEVEPLCLTLNYKRQGKMAPIKKKSEFRSGSFVTLEKCATEEDSSAQYAQELKARKYTKATSNSVEFESVEIAQKEEPRIGRYCLDSKSDLCIGLSLANGVVLEGNKLVQVKNLTKNSEKDLDELKMDWFMDHENQRLAAAANMDFCMEAIYDAPIGNNRKGVAQFDDIVHLGACDPNRASELDAEEQEKYAGLNSAEEFYTKEVAGEDGTYLELRTDVPAAVIAERASNNEAVAREKCVSVVKCVVHDFGHCTQYNSVPVYDIAELSQGAYVRLKDCDSKNMPSQRFHLTLDVDQTAPPTRSPTPLPPSPTNPPTKYPTSYPTTRPPTKQPTAAQNSEEENPNKLPSHLTTGLSLIGVFCFAVIIVGGAQYYKQKKAAAEKKPDEDENFIARV